MLQDCPLSDKHLLLMRNHSMDEETACLADDFIKSTNFYIHLGKIFLHHAVNSGVNASSKLGGQTAEGVGVGEGANLLFCDLKMAYFW